MRKLIVIVSLILGVSTGTAQSTPEPEPEALRQAKLRFEAAETSYRVGDFRKAAQQYKEAYRLSNAPGLLFNIAQALRLSGDSAGALHYYRGYLRDNPRTENRADVEGLITLVSKQIAEAKAKSRDDAAKRERAADIEKRRMEAETNRLLDQADDRRRAHRARRFRVAGISTMALGLASAGVGTAFWLRARSNWQDINELADGGGRWSSEYDEKYDAAEESERLSFTFVAAGAGVLIVGGVLYYLGRDSREQRSAYVAPGPGGVVVGAHW